MKNLTAIIVLTLGLSALAKADSLETQNIQRNQLDYQSRIDPLRHHTGNIGLDILNREIWRICP